ncbi:16S rRNA (guanine(1207)-N(2))-methyltransferase RsmC [Photobacterium sp. GJ3]|uniref:16S rRNA (guanine(1207)-N(2))-methyltransferase RsmC n=1 Tax=Photobacterium sp. GJ3 TaxID=2829502 RepID=UPI001B8B2238|nr:16S rRNA (guanine(1207)-N(2))-methyltransferase RsmC [Photobacterium sp. GJ3]QUJ67935.1 16S rRNA (guanine(1207)-N(2))-methyltransferase RsmC [Photobacterium sp. GJ3]
MSSNAATFSAASQVVARQSDFFIDRHVLVAGELDDLYPVELAKVAAQVQVFTTHYGQHLALNRFDSISSHFGAELSADDVKDIDMVLLYWPKAKAEANYLMAMLMSLCGKDTEICIVGENRSGVRSAEKMFTPYGPLNKYDSARRCSFYWGRCQETAPAFNLNDWFRSYPLTVGEHTLTIRSLPGVFSHGEFDQGSRLLIDNLPDLTGRVLDFGCGAGVIGAVLKTRYPDIQIDLADVSALAIASARETFRENHLEGHFVATDVYAALPDQYDFLISNPPFHAGLKTFYAATEQFIEQSPAHLTSQGELVIVANNFLQYPPLLERTLGNVDIRAKNNKFSIYHAKK